jgi:hypothetical protein
VPSRFPPIRPRSRCCGRPEEQLGMPPSGIDLFALAPCATIGMACASWPDPAGPQSACPPRPLMAGPQPVPVLSAVPLRRVEKALPAAWFRIRRFSVTEVARKPPVREGRISLRMRFCREAANLPGSSVPGLDWSEAQQRQPMRMALAGHQFSRAFAVAFGPSAAHEAPMVQEEPQQGQV